MRRRSWSLQACGVREAGILLSAFGLGSIAGGLWLAGCETRSTKLAAIVLGAMPVFAGALIGILLSPSLLVALPFAAIAGFGMIARAGAIQSLLQLESNPSYRGRIMALHGGSIAIGRSSAEGTTFVLKFPTA